MKKVWGKGMGLRKRKESDVVRVICGYLNVNGYKFWRQNNQAVFDPTKKIFRKPPAYCIKGVPDIMVLIGVRTIGLEVKNDGRQSKEQKDFENMWTEDAEGYRQYHIVRSIEDVEKILGVKYG